MSAGLGFKFNKSCRNIILAGSSFSGKSFLLAEILTQHEEMFEADIKSIIYCYSEYQDGYYKLEKALGDKIKFVNGLPSRELLLSTQAPLLLAMDDLQDLALNSPLIESVFTTLSHHKDILPILTVQNIFYKAKYARTISLNCQAYIIARLTRDRQQLRLLARSIFPNNHQVVMDAYTDAEQSSSTGFFYITIDCSSTCDPRFRVRRNILPSQGNPIVYLPKNGEMMM